MQERNAFAIVLAWPETACKKAGAWYDVPLHLVKFGRNGYYKVGHSAIVLIEKATGLCEYYDFGRYHAPHGFGRVRTTETDHDLKINTIGSFSKDLNRIININEILEELNSNPSTHGTGDIYASTVQISIARARNYIRSLTEKDFIPYGPFLIYGTNCSRFVNGILRNSIAKNEKHICRYYPLALWPTPMWNLKSVNPSLIRQSVSSAYFQSDSSTNDNYNLIQS